MSVTTNKAAQEAVRGFGQSPTNYAIETAIDRVAVALRLDRIEVRRRNFIRKEEFPYLIPSGTRYDSGDYHTVVDKVLAHVDWPELRRERDRLRQAGMLAGIGVAACLEPSGGNSSFEPLLNPKNTTTTWMESCRINVDALGHVTATIHTTSSGQGHETLAATVIGEVLEIDPGSHPHRAPGFAHLPAEQLAGRQPHGDHARAAPRSTPPRSSSRSSIADRRRISSVGPSEVDYAAGTVSDARGRGRLDWIDLVTIAHRNFHLLPPAPSPGLEVTHVYQVPTGGSAADRRRPRPDVSVPLVRVPPRAGRDRSRSRQDGAAPLCHRPRLRHRDQSRISSRA